MADTPAEFKVIDTRRLPSPDPERMGKWDTLVVYELDPMRRYSVLVPEDPLTEEALIAAVKADLTEHGRWLEKTFRL